MGRPARDPLYRRHRFPADVIAHTVWLHFCFPLCLRMAEDMLAARGIIVAHQTTRFWAEKFGRHFVKDIRKRSAGRLWNKWHLDEVVLTIRDKKHWLWRAADQNGFVLDVLVQKSPFGPGLIHVDGFRWRPPPAAHPLVNVRPAPSSGSPIRARISLPLVSRRRTSLQIMPPQLDLEWLKLIASRTFRRRNEARISARNP